MGGERLETADIGLDGIAGDRLVHVREAVGYDHRRFRPNILIGGVEELAETGWPGFALRVGALLIGVRNRRSRCVMTTFDPDTLEQDPWVLRNVVWSFGGKVALDCLVAEPGRVAVGDPVELVPE